MPDIFQFEDCELAHGKRTLKAAGREVAVEPKVFDLLLLFLRHRDQVLSKADLKAALWPDVTVSDAALTRLIKEARRAVGDDGGRQAVIRTVHRRGYRFVAEVRVGGGEDRTERGYSYMNAATQAVLREAYAEAENHYRRAIALLSERKSGHARLLCEALLALADTQRRSPSGAVDRAMLQRAIAVARVHRLGDEHARAVLALAGDGPNWRVDRDLVALLVDAHERATSPALRARLLARLAAEHSVVPAAEDAHALRADALAAARRAGPLAELDVMSTRHDWIWLAVPPGERDRAAASYLAAARGDGDHERLVLARLLRLRERLEAGDSEGFAACADALERDTHGGRWLDLRYRLRRLRIAQATLTGDFERAESLLELVSQPPCGHSIGDVWDDQMAQVAFLRAARGRFDIAPVCGPTSHQAPAVTARCVQVWLDARSGEHVQARYGLRELLRVCKLELLAPADAALVAAGCASVGESSCATALEDALAPLSGRNVLRGELACYGPCDDFLGRLAELRGDRARARRLYQSAIALAERSGARVSLIGTQLRLAALSKDEHRAELASRAAEQADSLGLAADAARARSLLQSPGAAPYGSPSSSLL